MTTDLFTPTVDPFEAAARMFEPTPLSPYLVDPVGWVRDRLGEFLWSKQREIADSVVHHRRTAVRSAHDIGKSFIASRVASWWVDIHPPGSAIVISTAPTYQQVHAILWEEIRSAAAKAASQGTPLPGRVLMSDQWKLDDGRLAGFGRKPADTDIHGFQGHHRHYVLVILDEACGVPEQLWTAVESVTTNAECRILAIGNPDDPNTEFGNICKPGSGWNVVSVSAFDTPNFTDEDVPAALRPLLIAPEWEEDKRRRWGVGSPRYISKVLGQFPELGTDTLISPSLIEAARQRALTAEGRGVLGVDVARYGMDRTVIYLRRGPVIRLFGEYAKQATTETTGRVIDAKRETGADEIRVDGVGVGGGVVDQLTEQGHPVLDMQAGAAAQDRERFVNQRAEWAWAMKTRLEDGDIDLDPADDDLAAQLGSIKYKYNSRGQIVIESKDEARKRGIPSPDHADAAILTAVAPAGADLFPKLKWRVWQQESPDRVSLAGRSWALADSWVYCTAHLPSGEDAAADWTVAAVWALTLDGDLVLLDRARKRVGDGSPFDLIRPLVTQHGADTTFIAKQQYPQVARAGQNTAGVHTTPLDVDPDPYTQALPASAKQGSGRVWLPPTAAWREAWMAEHLAFPNSRVQGCVTTLALAVNAAETRWVPSPAAQKPLPAPADREIDWMNVPL